MSYNTQLRKERFIEMAKETIDFVNTNYPDFGKFLIILQDDEPIHAVIHNDSNINRPNFSLYNHFIDRFNQEIYPKYLEFEQISFSYFGNYRTQNKMRAFMTQVLNALKVYAKDEYKNYSTIEISGDSAFELFEKANKLRFKFESSLHKHMEELIFEYIKNYDTEIITLSDFSLKYKDIYIYMVDMIPKIIDSID